MADGSIRVETKLDTDGVEAGLDDIEKMCEDTKKQLEKVGKELNIEAKVSLDTSAAEKACDNTKAELEKIAEALNFKVKPVSVTNENQLDKAQKRLREIQQKIEAIQKETDETLKKAATEEQTVRVLEMEAEETKKLVAEQKELNRAIEEYNVKKAEKAAEKQRQAEAKAAEREAKAAEREAKAAEKQRLAEAKATEKQYKSDVKGVNTDVGTSLVGDDFLSKINTAEEYEAALARVKGRMTQIEAETSKIAAAKGIDPADALRANTEYQKLKSKLEALTNTTKTFKKTSQDSFETARKSADHMGDGIKKAIATMSKYTIAIFGARSAFYAIKSAIGSAVSENEKLNNTVTAMKGVLAHALSPAIERVVYYIQYGLAYLNLFIKTLTGVDLVAQYNAKALKKQAEATKETAKATKDAKNQLAGFDEKNMLTSPSDNTAKKENPAATLDLPDVSGGKFEQICETIKKHLNEIGMMLAVGMMAVGFILLACGQIPMGIAAILAGIALAAVSLGNWNSLSEETKTMLSAIMAIAGTAFLAIGIILCCSGGSRIPLGIAMIVLGAGLLIGAAALNWGEISNKVKPVIDSLKKYLLGGLEIVFGAILCCTGVGLPLGIALIEEGVKTITSKETPNKDTLKTSVSDVFENMKRYLLGGLELVFGVILCASGIGLPLGLALIKQGLATIKSEEPIDGEALKTNISAVIENMKKYLLGGLEIVFGAILCCTGVGIPLGLALIREGLKTIKSEEPVDPNAIQKIVSRMWESVKSYWNTNIKPIFTANWWKSKFNAIPDGVKAAINTAISFVERGVNWIVGKINSISFTVPSWVPGIGGSVVGFNLPYVSIPRLARGGIVNNPGRGQHIIAGEAGAEAVLPLETNTEWMNILAEKIAERISIPIVNKFYVDSKEVATSYNKNQERFTFATNGGVL